MFLDFQPFLESSNSPRNYERMSLSCKWDKVFKPKKGLSLNNEKKKGKQKEKKNKKQKKLVETKQHFGG